ncbi:hypothetical protein [Ramlibacter sp. PS4R-6]|uniref:hypothetical protein n=1 Tax=Ramlibacter sp. PS4R-6 TaxID=3133438 RepID=UPI0030A2DAF9
MSDWDNTITNGQKKALARLATLQRLREEAREGHRPAMLDSIDKLIELEARLLRNPRDKENKPS